ncbi:MAG: hypothetical protein WCT48_05780 [Candidatus Paceibacterota bacterium]
MIKKRTSKKSFFQKINDIDMPWWCGGLIGYAIGILLIVILYRFVF